MSYGSLRVELHEKAKEIAEAMRELVNRIVESHGLPSKKLTLRVRTARTSYYKPYQLNLTFSSGITTILHEIKHHLDYVKDGAIKTYKESFESELFASAFACQEFNKWIDTYANTVLGYQVQYAELLDKYRHGSS